MTLFHCGQISLDCDDVFDSIKSCLYAGQLSQSATTEGLAQKVKTECEEINNSKKATEHDQKKYQCFQNLLDTDCVSPQKTMESMDRCSNL